MSNFSLNNSFDYYANFTNFTFDNSSVTFSEISESSSISEIFSSNANVKLENSTIIIKGTVTGNDTKSILHEINKNPSFLNMSAAEVCSKVETVRMNNNI